MRPALQDYDDRSEEIVVPLSPQDVRDKLFTPVRFRPGYDEDEVDAFLDEIETELTRLHAELARLRAGAAPAGGDAGAARTDSAGGDADARIAELSRQAREAQDAFQAQLQRAADEVANAQQQAVAAQQQATEAHAELGRLRASELPRPSSEPLPGAATAESLAPPSVSEETLRRTLVLAQRTADAAVAEARAEAGELVSSARIEAEQTAKEAAAAHVEQVRSQQAEVAAAAARARAEQELMMSKLEELRSFERDYRGRLRAYLHLQLRDLESGAPEPAQALTGRQTAAIGGGPIPDAKAVSPTGEHEAPASADVPPAVDSEDLSATGEPSGTDGSGGDGSVEPASPAASHLPDDTWNEYGQPSEEEEAR